MRIDAIRADQLVGVIDEFLKCGRSHIVHFVPAHPTVIAQHDDRYREVLNGGDLNLPDGMSIVWALSLAGVTGQRLPGTDAMKRISDWGVGLGLRHYLWGGAPDVPGLLRSQLQLENPGIQISGAESPPFTRLTEQDLERTAARIRATGTDLLWVGLGAPKQELLAESLRELRTAPVILCVGAAFDFISGVKRRPPEWLQRAGLEWVGRLTSEPRRLWRRYLVGNVRFVAGIMSRPPQTVQKDRR